MRVNALAAAAEIAAAIADRIESIHVERVLPVVDAFVPRRIQIPTKPEIDREPRADTPVVLREDAQRRGQRPYRRGLVNLAASIPLRRAPCVPRASSHRLSPLPFRHSTWRFFTLLEPPPNPHPFCL